MQHKSGARQFWGLVLSGMLLLSFTAGCRRNTTPTSIPDPGNNVPGAENLPDNDMPAQTGSLLFRDDFQDGQAQEWNINSAWNVKQVDDVYLFAAAGMGGAWVTEGGGWTDYMLHSSFRVNAGVLVVSINFSKAGRYGLVLGATSVYLFEEQPAGTVTILAEAGPITVGQWHRLSFASQAGHVQVHIDQVLWFDVIDPSPVEAGTIAVSATDGAQVGVDNVLVTKLKSTLQAGIPQAPAPVSTNPVEPEEALIEANSLPVEEVEVVAVEPSVAPPADPAGVPDLMISDVSFIPNPVFQGQMFTAEFVILNQGDGAAGAFTFRLHFHAAAGIEDCNMDVDTLAPGEAAWGSCTRTINGNTGSYPYEMTVDVENEITESNEGNNFLASPLIVEAPGLADIAVVSLEDYGITDGKQYYRCGTTNLGGTVSEIIDFNIYVNGVLLQRASGETQSPGEHGGFAFIVGYDPPFELTCTVDLENITAESNEDNNTLTIHIP